MIFKEYRRFQGFHQIIGQRKFIRIARNLIFGSGFRIIGLLANLTIGLFLMPFIVHRLGDRVYGYWTLVSTFLGYYGLLDLGIVSAVQFFVAKALGEKDEKLANQTISTSFNVFAILGVVIFLVTAAIALLSGRVISEATEADRFRTGLQDQFVQQFHIVRLAFGDTDETGGYCPANP
jgi:Na+-driven multidrug efflux pump